MYESVAAVRGTRMGILRMLQRRRIRTAFGQYLSPEAIEKILRETGSKIRPHELKHFQFVVVLPDDSNPQEAPAIIGKVMDILMDHHANVSHSTPALFIALLGVPFPQYDSAEARRELVDALLRENGDRIRIVHGQCDGLFGLFGSDSSRWTHGSVIPGFSGILKKLLDTKLGTAVEIS
jgi:hypothetical protein